LGLLDRRCKGDPMKVAIIGSGISGMGAAHALKDKVEVSLFEADEHFGGHAHTVDITLAGSAGPITHGVDTGFLVYNERTYPRLIALLSELGVPTVPTEMSFSVQAPLGHGNKNSSKSTSTDALEWSGTSLSSVFAQRSNLLRPAFWAMLRDLLRFNRVATALATGPQDAADLAQPLGDFLDARHFGKPFRDWYLLPMLGCIWSCPVDQMLRFPVATLVRFCHNHGLLQVANRPQWYTVTGGSQRYVERLLADIGDKRAASPVQRIVRDADGVTVFTAARGAERFDRVILATHSDQALALLDAPDRAEAELLGAIRYQPNRAVLHTDTRLLPTRKSAWAAWNYERAGISIGYAPGADNSRAGPGGVCLHYLINRLQPLPWEQPVIVSLNPLREPGRNTVMGTFDYAHPVFDAAAIAAQTRLPELQGRHRTYFCGAWASYGFHEDGLAAGQEAARRLLADASLAAGADSNPTHVFGGSGTESDRLRSDRTESITA
jgi:predicted NAD/FAD-binding protein